MPARPGSFALIEKCRCKFSPFRKAGGFTLIELIILLVLISLCAIVLVPRVGGSRERILGGNLLNDLEARLRYAQYHAVLEDTPFLFQYDRGKKRFEFLRSAPETSREQWLGIRDRWARSKPVPDPFSFEVRGKDNILFFPDGSASESDILLLKNKREIASIRLGRSMGTFEIRWKKQP